MNNLRLLAGLFAAVLLSGGARAHGPQAVFTPEDLFLSAEANSAQLRSSFAAQAEADREISVARTEMLPEIDARLSVSYIGDGFTTGRGFGDYQRAPIPHLGTGLSLNISQPVYTGGAVTSAIEMAELRSTAARYATDFRRDNLRFRLMGSYLDIYKCHNLKDVIESNLESARKVLREMHARYEQGTALFNDITRYELLVSDLELRLTKIDNTISILNADIVTTAGLPEATVVLPDTTILSRVLPHGAEQWWQQEAALNSPSLSLARSKVDISRKAEDLVRADRRPKIGLQAGWTIDGPILVEIPPVNRNLSYWFVGVGISYNISSIYKSDKTMARSRAATARAIADLEAAREDLSLAVHSDHIKYLEACEELKTRLKGVELAERNYRTVATRYAAGMALITDMLDAANARLEAGRQLVNARIDIIYYYYKLLFTSGKI